MKEKWKYYFSKALNMRYAYNKENERVMTEDKVVYEKEEYRLIKEITPEIHAVKKVFHGKIVS